MCEWHKYPRIIFTFDVVVVKLHKIELMIIPVNILLPASPGIILS